MVEKVVVLPDLLGWVQIMDEWHIVLQLQNHYTDGDMCADENTFGRDVPCQYLT